MNKNLITAATALAAPPTLTEEHKRADPAAGCSSAVTLDASTNVWKKYTLHPNKFYRDEVTKAGPCDNINRAVKEPDGTIIPDGSVHAR